MKPVAVVSSYVNITSGDQDALRAAIANKGPISVAIDAAHKSLSFYANGVYYEPQCGEYFSGKNLEKICSLNMFPCSSLDKSKVYFLSSGRVIQ